MIRAKIWKWPVNHPVWPAGGWAWTTSAMPAAWWPASSHEDALAQVASYFKATEGLRP